MVRYFQNNVAPLTAAGESFDFVLSTVYDYEIRNGLPYLADEYYERNLPIIQTRLIGGGVRLGTVLNSIFDPSFVNAGHSALLDYVRQRRGEKQRFGKM